MTFIAGHGPIRCDPSGRTFDIHHWDGDKTNNNIGNLVAVPIGIHYVLHYIRGDWGACVRIASRMKLSHKLISELAKRRSPPSLETRQKMSKSGKGKTFSLEHRRKIGEANKRRIWSESSKRKITESHIGNKWHFGYEHSEETKEKIRNKNLGKHHTEEAKQKMSEAQKGRKHSEKTKEKISKAIKEYHNLHQKSNLILASNSL